jgi:gamma-glutamyltranspeptidase/glutathione hydrolase
MDKIFYSNEPMKTTLKKILILTISLLLTNCQTFSKNRNGVNPVILTANERVDHASAEAMGKSYAVSTQGIYATRAAKEILNKGGNAIDAAVAASFVLAVERPHSTGIGGGGFMLFRDSRTKKIEAVDFRERAPKKSYEKMFQDKNGKAISSLSIDGILASGVPGLVAGLLEIHEKYGRLKREQILAPAITLADYGFPVYPSLAKALLQKESLLAQDPSASKIFLDKNKKALREGQLLVQSDLARTLKLISLSGRDVFYRGPIADAFARYFAKRNGLITKADLASYRVKWRSPVKGTFKGYEIFSMPPPSSGGVHVIQMLNMLEDDHLDKKGFLSAEAIHLTAQAMQIAFADRAKYLGDADFVKVPVQTLISKKYAQERRMEITHSARESKNVKAGSIPGFEHTETTHLSIIDKEGNIVSTTQTINGYMGSSLVLPGTGIVLNNEMDDFSAQPGAANLFGAIGGKANAVAPGKTPLSSMSPTIVLKNNLPVMSLGAPGGTRIITCVLQTMLNYLDYKLPLYESVTAIRFHHQWLPDKLDIDPPGPSTPVIEELIKRGHKIDINAVPCNVMAVAKEGDILHAVSDPRDIGTSAAL